MFYLPCAGRKKRFSMKSKFRIPNYAGKIFNRPAGFRRKEPAGTPRKVDMAENFL
jgi:hypothetical protein